MEEMAMRVAVISDTHGNLLALDAVLADLDASGPYDEVVMAGDFAFGGPFPSECIERIRTSSFRAVRGNTDEFIVEVATNGAYQAQGVEDGQRHTAAQIEIDRWVAERLTGEQVDYLAGLPLRITISDQEDVLSLAVVHSTPWSTHPRVEEVAPVDVARRVVDESGARAVAYGHIHVQFQRRLNGRLLVAVGSVGLPFDGDQRAAYAVVTSSDTGWLIDFHRVAYNVDLAVDQILRSGVPSASGFAETLKVAAPRSAP
jgi:predicted phosphodiesterase